MIVLDQIRQFILNLDSKQFQRYLIIILSIILCLIGIVIYRYYSSISFYKKRIYQINQQRRTVKEILERFEIVKKQQTEVNTLLEKDRDFKIAGYFNNVINKLGISQNKTREPETSSEELDNGYTEIKLFASFSNMNMQRLTELLDTLEQNERIYTKEIEVYKPDQEATININILIATLEPKTELELTE
ncbi:MAG: hypothetical protein WDZ41_03115 [Candidatus Babeliales bacterium]